MIDEFIESSIKKKKLLEIIRNQSLPFSENFNRCTELIKLIDNNLLIHCAKYN